MPELAIVMTYYQRQKQLNRTLESLRQYDSSKFVVVIVDDDSPDDIILPELPYEVDILKLRNKTWHNSASVYNWGFHRAFEYNPKVIIIQNAECQHWGDILSAAKEVTDGNYIAFPAYSLAENEEASEGVIRNKAAEFNGESAWYNHSVYRPHAFHFCSAITVNNLKKINGFDERLCDGIAYEDNVLVHHIRNLGLRIDIPERPMVFHQWHYSGGTYDAELVERNKNIWLEIEKDDSFRAVHALTPDL